MLQQIINDLKKSESRENSYKILISLKKSDLIDICNILELDYRKSFSKKELCDFIIMTTVGKKLKSKVLKQNERHNVKRLSNCPFCGKSSVFLQVRKTSFNTVMSESFAKQFAKFPVKKEYRIICITCGITTGWYKSSFLKNAILEVAKKWNRRKINSDPDTNALVREMSDKEAEEFSSIDN